jgi:hypothetical protein
VSASIETVYSGVTFRSRLEARWAVFFDSLGVTWLYEPEGYEFPSMWWHGQSFGPTRYLPDFHLPLLNAWLEIKPTPPSAEEEARCDALATATGQRVYLFAGHVGEWLDADRAALSESGYYYVGDSGQDMGHLPCLCPTCGRFGIEFDGRADRIKCACRKSEHGDKGYNAAAQRIREAAAAARAHRFWAGPR